MSDLIAVVGPSGEGKSTSIEHLDPKTTFIVNTIGKPLPFKGWRSIYTKADPANNTGNYVEADKSAEIVKIFNYVNTKRPEIKQLVLDDGQFTMAYDAMSRSTEKGYEKWSDLARHIWDIMNCARTLRSDLKVFFLWHDETVAKESRRKMKTLGAMIDNTITLEGLFTVVLFTKVTTDQKTKENVYQFVTQTEDGSTAKSPKGMFEERYIPNDLAYVCKKIDEYYN
jgi:predicted kinase